MVTGGLPSQNSKRVSQLIMNTFAECIIMYACMSISSIYLDRSFLPAIYNLKLTSPTPYNIQFQSSHSRVFTTSTFHTDSQYQYLVTV